MSNIKDVADRAGVSIATVSYVMNKSRSVRPETAQRVQTAVDELGYSINVSARNLASRRVSILGLIISDILNPFFPEIIRAFQEHALLHDMETIVMYTNYDPQRTMACARRLLGLRVPGVAVLTTEFDDSIMPLLTQHEICAVYLDQGHIEPLNSNIVVDYAVGIKEALTHLKGLGHQRIGFISGPPTLPSAYRRRAAFTENIGEEQAATMRLVDSDFSVKGGYQACEQMFGDGAPTALIAANDLMAIGAMHWAYDHNLRIPNDLSIVGFDNIQFSEFTQPPLTTIDQPAATIGRLAFEALWETVCDDQRAGREIAIDTHLVIRQTTAPLIP